MRMPDYIENGASLSEAVMRANVFCAMTQEMIIVGEQTGTINDAFEHVSRYNRKQLLHTFRKAAYGTAVVLLLGMIAMGALMDLMMMQQLFTIPWPR